MILVAPDHIESASGHLNSKQTAVEQHAISGKFQFKSGDIVYSKIRPYLRKAFLADFEGICSADMYPLTPASNVSARFMLAILLGHDFSTFAEAVSVRSGFPKINRTELAEYRFALPPPAEQRAIATALSDADVLITSLGNLIAKKRNIKQAAMQELLTGKRRLPGFNGDWELKRLGDLISDIADGGTPSTSRTEHFGGCINWIVIEDINDEIFSTEQTLTEEGLSHSSARIWPPGSIILSTGATIGEVGITKVHSATKQGICGIIVNQSADSIFLKYWFKQNKPLLLAKAQGSSIKEVRPPTLVKLELNVPVIDEQRAIATVLSDMDAELTAMEQKRDKTKAIKQGMMQELLTGRIRLV
jgi:type I restriction enzyme S subunit